VNLLVDAWMIFTKLILDIYFKYIEVIY